MYRTNFRVQLHHFGLWTDRCRKDIYNAGKTSELSDRGISGENTAGLQPRVLDHLFNEICQKRDEDPDLEFEVKCSYFEIYNEQIMDLVKKKINFS